MAFLSSYYPQPLIAGTTAGTYAAGDDSRITGALPAATAGTGSVLASGSTTARTLSNRFSDTVNILDFGADPTGLTDSWLAIQRALCFARGVTNASSLTINDTMQWGGSDTFLVPRLFRESGSVANRKTVFIPSGTYLITHPIVISTGDRISGDNSSRSKITMASNARFNTIESLGTYVLREIFSKETGINTSFSDVANLYMADTLIENIYCQGDSTMVAGVGHSVDSYSWYRWPMYQSSNHMTATGSSGETAITITNSPYNLLSKGDKIRFYGHNTIYTVQTHTGSSMTISPALSQTISNAKVLYGFPAHNGIFTEGGENFTLKNCYINRYHGVGFLQIYGSPSTVLYNLMANICDIGYWIDNSPATLIQPSGDGNNEFIRTGWTGGIINMTVISLKAELAPTTFRTFIAYKGDVATSRSQLTIIGGTFNAFSEISSESSLANKKSLISVYKLFAGNYDPVLNVIGFRGLNACQNTFATYDRDGGILRAYGRSQGDDGEIFFHMGNPAMFAGGQHERFGESSYSVRFRGIVDENNQSNKMGILADDGSGLLDDLATFTRSGTTATVTYNNHGMKVGHYVHIPNGSYQSLTGSGILGIDTNYGYESGSMRVMTVPNANTFTLTVLNSGPTAGSCKIAPQKMYEMMAARNGEIRHQIGSDLGSQQRERTAFGWYDLQRNRLAGLRVSTATEGQWWASKELSMGGTIDSPASRILHGTGIPSVSAPDGSIFLRTDGAADTTLYIRAGGSWTALTST